MVSPSSKPIVDIFMGNDEIELASFRINYLWKVVTSFVIGESSLTFTGIPKAKLFSSWLEKHPELQSRVHVIELSPSGKTAWEREIDSREQLTRKSMELFPGHAYIISDLDEIPSSSQVEIMQNLSGDFHFPTPTSYRRANWLTQDWNAQWNKGVYTSRSDFNLPNAGRLTKLPRIENSQLGSHLSYLGFNSTQMKRKLESSPHAEYAISELSSEHFLSFCDKFRIDHLGRISSPKFGLLRVLPQDKLSNLQLELLKVFPEWFDFSKSSYHFLMRLRASALVSIISNRHVLSPIVFSYISECKIPLKSRVGMEISCFKLVLLSVLRNSAKIFLNFLPFHGMSNK